MKRNKGDMKERLRRDEGEMKERRRVKKREEEKKSEEMVFLYTVKYSYPLPIPTFLPLPISTHPYQDSIAKMVHFLHAMGKRLKQVVGSR